MIEFLAAIVCAVGVAVAVLDRFPLSYIWESLVSLMAGAAGAFAINQSPRAMACFIAAVLLSLAYYAVQQWREAARSKEQDNDRVV